MDWRSILTTVLPAVFTTLEILFPRKPGTAPQGSTKFGQALNIAQTILTSAATTGNVTAEEASDVSAITGHMQGMVIDMKSRGQLGGFANKLAVAPVTAIVAPVPNKVQGIDYEKIAALAKPSADPMEVDRP